MIYRRIVKRWKYLLGSDETVETDIFPKEAIETPHIVLDATGLLTVKQGYAWDGASGPMRDDRTNMRASLVHDALYQLLRLRLLPDSDREAADALFRDLCLADGMKPHRANRAYCALRRFGAGASKKLHRSDRVKWETAP